MKKTYINPTLEVVKVATQQMLAASNKLSNDSATTDGTDYTKALGHDDDFDWDD